LGLSIPKPRVISASLGALLLYVSVAAEAHTQPADYVLANARIYTAVDGRLAEALAVRDGRLVYVGSSAGVREFIGPRTHLARGAGRLVIPGLIDSHVHPADILDLDVCDIDSKPLTLRELSAFVKQCLARYGTPAGHLLVVHQWSFGDGNQPEPAYPTLRAALDDASTTRAIQLIGDDGHHGAFNSLALAQAKNARGVVVGISKGTLSTDFAPLADVIGVDEQGEPDGAVNEDARYTINPRSMVYVEYEAVLAHPELIPRRFNSVGITAIMDAMALPEGLPIWDELFDGGKLTLRVTLAQFYDPSHSLNAEGRVDFDGLVGRASAVRARYAENPLIRSDFIKLFADGVVEANPFSNPPTLGNAAMLHPYLQPIFSKDAEGHAAVTGYVDTASRVCADVRTHPERFQTDVAVKTFMAGNGYHPAQCRISDGQLQHTREIELEYVRRMHVAGFNLHIHAIGDRAVRTAVDAIEAARAFDGNTGTHDSLAHVQFADPADVSRIGRDHLYVVNTYSWANVNLDYDMMVVPFLTPVTGNSYASRHTPGNYFEENTYPFRSEKDAGATLVAGSDAPVNTRDPQPFVNMSIAVTRHLPESPPLNPKQAIGIRDVLEAYTIDGARFLGRDREIGSLEAGKSADFVILDRDILALADSGQAERIAGTKVLETWFRGERVYRARKQQ
jgi:predicted amidohydrolase YtcJ